MMHSLIIKSGKPLQRLKQLVPAFCALRSHSFDPGVVGSVTREGHARLLQPLAQCLSIEPGA